MCCGLDLCRQRLLLKTCCFYRLRLWCQNVWETVSAHRDQNFCQNVCCKNLVFCRQNACVAAYLIVKTSDQSLCQNAYVVAFQFFLRSLCQILVEV